MGCSTGGHGKKVDSFDPRLLIWGWGALEADYLRFYQIDLTRAVWESGMSLHRFMTLTSGLPPDSAWVRFLQNDDAYSAAILYD